MDPRTFRRPRQPIRSPHVAQDLGPDLLVAQALADVATIRILHQRVLVHGGHYRFRPRRSQFPRTGLDRDRGPRLLR